MVNDRLHFRGNAGSSTRLDAALDRPRGHAEGSASHKFLSILKWMSIIQIFINFVANFRQKPRKQRTSASTILA
jgi:hypothetical protein